MRIEFEWDPVKAASNRTKHGVAFDEAMAIFLDPLAMSKLDEGRSGEERWVTLGAAAPDKLFLVVHTHTELTDDTVAIRIISARRPTRREARQYAEGRPS